eukprot:a175539_176.p1 GENE.a175539_176~~a175539_176.p1  ORF type:complete len:244 (+),score=81.95 a175539_176:42-734(+)
MSGTVSYLTQAAAIASDADLMADGAFSTDQLMELAGLSVASAIALEFAASSRVLVIAGPGNNGGDGLVALRHLLHFGFACDLFYPKRPANELLQRLAKQAAAAGARTLESMPEFGGYDLVVDAIFGFSFKLGADGSVRAPFDAILTALCDCKAPIVCVDIPSGWDVERGFVGLGVPQPAMLVSLTAPKLGVAAFAGIHYVGGRYVPPWIAEKYSLTLPRYEGAAQCVRIG